VQVHDVVVSAGAPQGQRIRQRPPDIPDRRAPAFALFLMREVQ